MEEISKIIVSVVVPVFGRDDVLTTVPNLLKWYPNVRIVVVDNGNEPCRASKLSALECERVEVIRLDVNCGGSGGYIAGMKRVLEQHLDSELVWLLDDDAEPNDETLTGLIRAYKTLLFRGEKVASVGSAIIRKNERGVIAECGASYLSGGSGVGFDLCLNGEHIDKHIDEINHVEYCSACSCIVTRTALEEVGLWEDVFIHYDDVEWGLRAEHRFGYKNFATTMSTVLHPEVTISKSGSWIRYYDMFNKLWIDQMYAPKEFAREYRVARKRELWAQFFNLNVGRHYAYRLIMSDFRAGRRKTRAEVVACFANHNVVDDFNLLGRKNWRDAIESSFPPFRYIRKLYRRIRHHGEFSECVNAHALPSPNL